MARQNKERAETAGNVNSICRADNKKRHYKFFILKSSHSIFCTPKFRRYFGKINGTM